MVNLSKEKKLDIVNNIKYFNSNIIMGKKMADK